MAEGTYGLSPESALGEIEAPPLAFRPPAPRNPARLPIGVIGCGGIAESHLRAYAEGGFSVAALCDHTSSKAEARRAEFFPDAAVISDADSLLRREDIGIIDITTHVEGRAALIEAALRAGKHVLSQKPFVADVATGIRLCNLADDLRLKLAVNQNGRWAPHYCWLWKAVQAGVIGEISTVDCTAHWDHHWILGTDFEEVSDLILFDFGIHWFDLATLLFGDRPPLKVYAAAARSGSQRARPPFLAHAAVEFRGGQATFAFNADCAVGHENAMTVVGAEGAMRSAGPTLQDQTVTLYTRRGVAHPVLSGRWFPDGFQGAMGELLCAIEDEREPLHSGRDNLRTVRLCAAARESARRGEPVSLEP